MINLISISQARSKLPDLVAKINEKLERTVITVNGKPKAVMLSIDELESLEETAKVLTIPKIKQDLKMSRKQIERGKFTPLSQLK